MLNLLELPEREAKSQTDAHRYGPADDAGMPLAAVLEVIGGFLGSE